MAKKIIRNKEITKATRKFTDREQPRKVFWDKYDSMKQNLHELDDIYIITYYGVGGIGKSTLLRKLENELIEKEKKPYFVKYDFESAIDAKSVLTMIKTKLENEYKFDFPLFDIALYAYAKKIGENMERPEIKSLTEKSKVLSLIMDGVEEVPLIGLGAKLFRLADSGLAILKSNNKKYKEEIIKIENESAEETYKRLPYYFSQDLINNVQNLDKPLVIFLDTYEKLVNEVKAEGYSIMNDIWLRDDNGPILQVPGVLWVIAGREKIKWGEYDQDWEDTLDQHILGDLSFNDASSFLLEAGISDEKLRKDIYDLTNGTPVYLDICVSTYEILKENEEEITIDKFGKTPEVLVERFIRYMDHQSSEMVYMLSQIGTFNDEIIMAVASKILPNFSLVLYEKIKNLSFICTANNNYYIHKTVNNIFKEECPKIIKEKTTTTMYDYYYDFIINSSKLNENYSNAITGYFDTFFELINKDNSVKLIDDAYNVFYELENNCLYNEFILYAKKIYKQTDKFVEAKNKFIIEIIYGKSLYFEGKLLESAKILEKVLDYLMPFDDMDENNYTVYETMSAITIDTLSSIYNTYPNYQMISKIIKYMENHFADDDDVACYNLAILYGLIDDEQKSIKLQEKLFEQNDKNKLPICLTLLTKFTSFEEDNQKYLYYFNKLQELLENDNLEITIYNKINAYLFLADAYLNKFIYLDKALTYINKAEKIMKEEMYNSNSRLLYKITTLKLTILTKMENQENLKSYANRKYEELQNSLDLYNVDNVNTLTSLLRSLNDESRYNLYEEILTNFNDNLHVLYHLAVSNIDDKDIAQKCVDTILKEINNLSTDNIEIVKKTVFDIAPGIYDNEQVNDFIIKICSFYETKFENTLALIPIYEGFKYFYFSIRDIENCLIYTEKKKNLIEKHYGKNSFEYAKILYELAILQQQNKNEQETLKYAEEAKAIFEKFDEKQEAAKCEVLMALDITINNRFEGIKKLQELYTKYENNESIAGDILSSIAYYSADYDTNEDTIKICLENYNFFKEKYGINNKETLNALNTLGSAYHYLGDDEKALEMLLKAKEGFIKYCSKYNNNAKINLENIVEIYYQNANYNELLETAFILLERYNLLMESTEKKAMLLYKITYSYFNLKNYEETLKYGIIAYEMSHDNETATINNLYYIIISLIALNKDYQNYLSEFLKLYDNQNLYHLTLLNSIYINSNNLDKALDISINAYALAFKTYGKSEELVYYIKKVLDNSDDLEMFDICIQKEEELYQIYKDTEEAIALKHLVSKAFYLKKNGQIEEAISLSENVIKRFDELNVKNRDYIKCLNNLIILLAENDMLEKAKIYYDLALNLIDILEDNDSLKTALINKKRYFE